METLLHQLVQAITEAKDASDRQFTAIRWDKEKNMRRSKNLRETLDRRVKQARLTEFKKEGNEKQFKFNDERVEKSESAEADLEQVV